MGSEWVQRGAVTRRARLRGRCGPLAEGAAWPAGNGVGRVRDGDAVGQYHRARRGALARVQARGWDVGRDGLFGAPAVRVLAGAERHGTIDRSLRLLGLGERALEEIPATAQGAMDATLLARALAADAGRPTIVCAQAGNVNTGACDDLRAVTDAAREIGAWVHVDGAFGLWAAASPRTRGLVEGLEHADSWSCDGHKWLNVPYDSGYAFCAHPKVHASAMAYTASYLTGQVEGRVFGGGDFARGVVSPRPGVHDVGGDPVAGTVRCGGSRRSLLCARPPARCGRRRDRRGQRRERGRPRSGS